MNEEDEGHINTKADIHNNLEGGHDLDLPDMIKDEMEEKAGKGDWEGYSRSYESSRASKEFKKQNKNDLFEERF